MQSRIFFLLSLAFVIFSLWPTVYEVQRRNDLQPNRYFELVHNFPTDFNFYLSRIREGLEGNLTVTEVYTSEPHQGSYIHIMYLALGWLGRWVRVPWHLTSHIYHATRIVLGMCLLLLTAELAMRTFKTRLWQILSYLLAVTASTWPIFSTQFDGWRIGGYMPWWSVMDSLQRITFIPHLVAGQALLLFLNMALSNEKIMSRSGNWIFLGVLALVLGIIFPPGLLFVFTCIFFYILLDALEMYLSKKKLDIKAMVIRSIIPRAIVALISIPSLVYLQLMTSFYPWKRLAEFDILHPLPFAYPEYLRAVGPVLPLGILGLMLAFWRRDKRQYMSMGWIFAWAALLFIFDYIPAQSPLRFSEMTPHIPLAMLAAFFFQQLADGFKAESVDLTITKIKQKWTVRQMAFVIIPSLLILLEVGHMFSSWRWQRDFVDHKIRAYYPLVPTGSFVMYPLKDFVAAIRFIQDNTARSTIVLSETTAGNYIPVYSGNRVFVGHANTVNAEEKELQTKRFFAGQIPTPDAYDWMRRENIRIVFFGPQEQEDGKIDLPKLYPFLEEVYRNDSVVVYNVPIK